MKLRHFLLFTLFLSGFILLSSCSKKESRTRINFGENWKFSLNDSTPGIELPGFDDASWRTLDLPHDWSIEGEFSNSHPASPGGGALPGGLGWYRKTFTLSAEDSLKMIYIDFDGVYRNSEVWINGHYLGKRPYGYSSFRYDLSPYLHFGTENNTLVVKADNSQQPNSRWYSGSGIYRNVWLVKTGKINVDHWGSRILTTDVSEKSSGIDIVTTIRNNTQSAATGKLDTRIIDPKGKEVLKQISDFTVEAGTTTSVKQNYTLNNPDLWSVENPSLYTSVSKVIVGSNETDEYSTDFGIRSFVFDRNEGFILNGKKVKILGVCNHHDLGCLGSAINKRALERQLEILKDMGCNAIRTSHNPPAPELLDLCDQMGFIVMDEAFDMWKKGKNPFDYHLDWDEWHKKDLQDLIMRDRNHPSVFMWSIGNEILEQWDSTGIRIASELAAYVKELDTSRPITSACNETKPFNNIIKSGALDLIGYNYHQNEYPAFRETYAQGTFIGSETTSALATRGHYDMNSDSIRRWPAFYGAPFTGNADNTCSAYDNCSAPWGSTHEESWKVIKKYDFLSGMFIWTGFDYLGEPTPYWWPSRSSYFGIIDLAGFPKDAYYMYQSEWTQKPVLHLYPHWNWAEGDSVDMWVYSNYDEVELFLNGTSMGTKKKINDELHLQWRLAFTPGEVKAVAKSAGKEDLVAAVKTAGKPAKIELIPDRNTLTADGQDLSFITVKVLDENGVPVPDASNNIKFKVSGEGSLAGTDNGDPVSHESFKSDSKHALNGLCLAVIKTTHTKGNIEVTAESEGLSSSSVTLVSK